MVYVIPDNRLDPFAKRGFPGRYHSMATIATTKSGSFTGSGATTDDYGYGYGAFMLGASSDTATTKIYVAGGGVLNGEDLPIETIFDISPRQIQSTGGNIYVFKRQQ